MNVDSERTLAGNQVAFRKINQRVPKGFDELREIAKEDNQLPLVEIPRGLLLFRCECSDEQCLKRVRLSIKSYQRIHKRGDKFCVAKGHVVPEVEDVVEEHREYVVVKKKKIPPQDVRGLRKTHLHFH